MLEAWLLVLRLGCMDDLGTAGLAAAGRVKAASPQVEAAGVRWGDAALDCGGGRLFLPGVNQVRVLGLDGGDLGVVEDLPGAQGVGLAPELGIGFACNSRAGTVAIFNLATLEVEKRLRTTGAGPASVLFEPATRRLFAFNERGRNATAFDAFGGAVAGSIPLGGSPGLAVADGAGRLFVSLGDLGEIAILDARQLAVIGRWSLPWVSAPVALALDPGRHRLFTAGADGTLVILDSRDGTVASRLALGGPVAGLACDAGTGQVYVASGRGTLRVVDTGPDGRFRTGNPVATSPGVQAVLLDPHSHCLYLPAHGATRRSLNIQAGPLVVPIRIVGDHGGPGDGNGSKVEE